MAQARGWLGSDMDKAEGEMLYLGNALLRVRSYSKKPEAKRIRLGM